MDLGQKQLVQKWFIIPRLFKFSGTPCLYSLFDKLTFFEMFRLSTPNLQLHSLDSKSIYELVDHHLQNFIMNNFMVSVSMNKRTYLEGVQLMRFDLGERKPGLLDKSRFIQFEGVIPLLAILEGDFMAVSIGRSIKVPLNLIQKIEPGSARIDFRSKSRSLYRGPCWPWNIS